jgi:hypothetical protein
MVDAELFFASEAPGDRQVVEEKRACVKKDRATSRPLPGGKASGGGKVRSEKVARARKLLEDPGYPPAEVIAAVADKLAQQWRRPIRRRSY